MSIHPLRGVWFLSLIAIACSRPSSVPPAQSPSNVATVPPAAAKQPEAAPAATTPKGVISDAPSSCDDYVVKTEEACPIQSPVADKNAHVEALTHLDAALSSPSNVAQNQKLATLERCGHFEPGLIAALRADLAPAECADRIVEPWLTNSKMTLSLELSQLMRGLSIGARLMRAEVVPPTPPAPFTRQHFEAFLKEHIRPWYSAQSRAIYDLASEGSKLSGYGKAITAVEAGLSDLRFVEAVRRVPLPEELRLDSELVEVYQQGLEDALEPRKLRGRDAILVGLLHLGQQGVLDDRRFYRAQTQLMQLFAGSRIDALSGLLLPKLPDVDSSTVVGRLAAHLPPFYSDRLLTPEEVESPAVLRALLVRGLGPKLRQHVERLAYERPEIAQLFARALLELGMKYFRPADFTRATIILGTKGALDGPSARETRLVAALSSALEGGPENTVQLMLTGPMLPDSMGKIEKLQQLAKEKSVIGGLAAYDAAHLMTVIPQREPNPEHWEKAARAFDLAASKLHDEKQIALAKARAYDARATAQQIRAGTPPSSGAKPPPVAKTPDPPQASLSQ